MAFWLRIGLVVAATCIVAGKEELARLTATHKSFPTEFASLLNFTLNSYVLEEGIAYGANRRFDAFLQDVRNGRKMSVVALGGSFTSYKTADGGVPWFDLYTNAMAEAFPNLSFINQAKGATTCGYAFLCLNDTVPQDAGLVLIEYNMNEGGRIAASNDPRMIIFERLIRAVLELPSKPAVVVYCLHYPHAEGEYRRGIEDQSLVLSQYYGITQLSARDAFYPLQSRGAAGFCDNDTRTADGFHYNKLMQAQAAELPMYYTAERWLHLPTFPVELYDLPPPFYKDNATPDMYFCATDEKMQQYVASAQGWQFMQDPHTTHPKVGYLTFTPGDFLMFSFLLKTWIVQPGEALLYFAYLKTPQRAGKVKVTCSEACACADTVLDGYNDVANVSIIVTMPLPVTISSPTDACMVRLTNLNETQTGENKFRLAGVMMGEKPKAGKVISYQAGHA